MSNTSMSILPQNRATAAGLVAPSPRCATCGPRPGGAPGPAVEDLVAVTGEGWPVAGGEQAAALVCPTCGLGFDVPGPVGPAGRTLLPAARGGLHDG